MNPLLAIAIGAMLVTPQLGAAGEQNSGQCFFLEQWTGSWKPGPGNRSIYIRVQSDQVYKLSLDSAEPMLGYPLVTLYDRQTQTVICGPLDFHLWVTDGTGAVAPLIVRAMTRLTPAEVRALPKAYRP